MKYQSIPHNSKTSVEKKLLCTTNRDELCLLLLSISETDDWIWAQNILLTYINNTDKWVAGSAINALGLLAKNHRNLDKEKVISSLKKIKNNDLLGKIDDTVSDINIFIKTN
jgi:hypothetical protein